ncbi:hypothetical protein [Streptomyces chryseus]
MKKRTIGAAVAAGVGLVALGFPAATVHAAPTASGSGVVTTFEKGHVLSCTGQVGKQSVAVELYDNSLHGSFVNVSLEGPDGQYGGDSTPATLFDNGSVNVKLPIRRLGEVEQPAGTASIKGIYALKGEPTSFLDVYEDGGWLVESAGTHHDLKSKVSVEVFGETERLTCEDAFAYDLKVTKTPV